MRIEREHTCLAAFLVLFICRAVLACVIVPPWQGPDEPTHFALTWRLAMFDGGTETTERRVEREVIQSMGRYRWWEPYGGHTPDVLPASFDALYFGHGTYAQPLYYGVGAAVLRATQNPDLETAYWRLRMLSIAIGAASIAFGWAGTRLLFGTEVAGGASAIAALHPQFLLNSIAVSSTVLTAFWGAFAWWQIGRLVRGHRTEASFVLLVIAAVAALLTKRSAIPFALLAIVIGAAAFLVERWRTHRVKTVLMVVTLAVAGPALLAALFVQTDQWREVVDFWSNPALTSRPIYEGWLPGAAEHALQSIDYLWLIAGWTRFEARESWQWAARVLTVAGTIGAIVLLIQGSVARSLLSIAWLFVGVQVIVITALAWWGLSVPTGRYADSVLAPMTALLWLGITRGCPMRWQKYTGVLLIGLLAIMDITAFSSVLIPAYLPWG